VAANDDEDDSQECRCNHARMQWWLGRCKPVARVATAWHRSTAAASEAARGLGATAQVWTLWKQDSVQACGGSEDRFVFQS
jgi:hypothetical protein